MTASTAVFDRSSPGLDEPATNSQLSRVVALSHATVNLLVPLRRIAELVALPDNWDSYGSPRINAVAAQRAILVLFAAEMGFPPPPRIVPVSGGGLQIEWAHGNRELEIEILPGGAIEVLAVEGERTFEWEVPTELIPSVVPNLVSTLFRARIYAAANR